MKTTGRKGGWALGIGGAHTEGWDERRFSPRPPVTELTELTKPPVGHPEGPDQVGQVTGDGAEEATILESPRRWPLRPGLVEVGVVPMPTIQPECPPWGAHHSRALSSISWQGGRH